MNASPREHVTHASPYGMRFLPKDTTEDGAKLLSATVMSVAGRKHDPLMAVGTGSPWVREALARKRRILPVRAVPWSRILRPGFQLISVCVVLLLHYRPGILLCALLRGLVLRQAASGKARSLLWSRFLASREPLLRHTPHTCLLFRGPPRRTCSYSSFLER